MNISLRKTNSNEISERATYRKLGAFCWVLSIRWKISIAFNFPSGINAINFSCIVLLLGNSAVSWLSVRCPRKFSYYLPLFWNIWLNGRRSLSFCVLEFYFVYLGYMPSAFVMEQSESLLFAPNIGHKKMKIRSIVFHLKLILIQNTLEKLTFREVVLRKTFIPYGMRRKVMETH